MKEKKLFESEDRARRKQAAKWVAQREIGLSAIEQDEFTAWLTDNPKNKEAYVSANRSWDELDRLLGIQTSYNEKVDPDLFDKKKRIHLSFQGIVGNRKVVGLAASILLLFSILPLIRFSLKDDSLELPKVEFSRIEKLNLDDGSLITLNHNTEVIPEFTDELRLVRLIRGEAIFEVEKDASRPFVVDVSGIRIKAVGTAFNIKKTDVRVDVMVTEGLVSLDTSVVEENENIEEHYVSASYKASITLDAEEPLVQLNAVDEAIIEEETLWKPALINFDNVPLNQIIQEFNRRNPKKLMLRGSGFETIRLTSYFWSDNVEGFLRLIETKYGIQVVDVEEDTYFLTYAENVK